MVQRKVIVRGATNQALDELDASDIPDLSATYDAAGAAATHVADTSAAHAASSIGFTPNGSIAATDVQAAIQEVRDEAAGSPAASGVTFTPNGSIAATNVQDAIQEVRDEAGGGAPTGADYLVGTAQGGLSAEIVVGTTPGGELGGTWASPTVDATHGGGTHAATQAAAEATAAAALATHAADTTSHDLVFASTPSDIAINSVTDITIATVNVANVAAGDQILVDAWFIILNNSTAARAYSLSLDFDGVFPAENITGALAASATLMHPFHLQGTFNVRATNLTYGVVEAQGLPIAGLADDANFSMVATPLQGMVWGTQTTDVTGTVTVAFFIRSSNATATQTCRLVSFTVRKVTP